MKERSLQVRVPIGRIVYVTENDGGYLSGRCMMCHQGGWLEPRYGYPHGAKGMGNKLFHTETCPMNNVLNIDGSVLPE